MNPAGAALRKIIYLSGTRADFGLMKSTLLAIGSSSRLSVAVTGMHLEPSFGRTIDDIRAAGLAICGEIPVDVQTRTPESMSAAVGHCLAGVTHLLQRERPDILLVLGDRGEMLAGAIATLHLGIVCVHIHGGERSGTVDEPVRYAISKLSSYHLVATQESRERLVRMGEEPDRICVTGAPGLDGLSEAAAAGEAQCKALLDLPPGAPFVLGVFHPVVQQAQGAYEQTVQLLLALRSAALPVMWSEPNADAGSRDILRALDDIGLPPGSVRASHLKRPVFCAAMKLCAAMVGNSSAGIIEAASFGTPVVNIGSRQSLRERNPNVHDVNATQKAIGLALAAALAHGKWPCDNRYGDGLAGSRIQQYLMALSLDRSILEKTNAY